MASPKLKKGLHLAMISSEHRKAKEKHPKFCDKFTSYNVYHSGWDEKLYKKKNDKSPHYADNLLLEEIAEARTAYLEGDKKHCLQELAQCGAVILRMMQFVQDEL